MRGYIRTYGSIVKCFEYRRFGHLQGQHRDTNSKYALQRYKSPECVDNVSKYADESNP